MQEKKKLDMRFDDVKKKRDSKQKQKTEWKIKTE